MDAQKFGAFIAKCRKEKGMTQAALAIKLQVTDKAVSRWERGLGFPDINTIEPLAEALGLSVLEIMKSEKIDNMAISPESASNALTDVFDMVREQRKKERKTVFIIGIIVLILTLLVLYIDSNISLGGDTVTGTITSIVFSLSILVVCAGVPWGAGLVIYGVWRKIHHLPCRQTFIAAGCLFILSIFIICFPLLLFLLYVITDTLHLPI